MDTLRTTKTVTETAKTATVKSELNTELNAPSLSERFTWQFAIVLIVSATFCLGFPQFHYTAALMVAAILRYKDTPGGIFAPISF